MSEYKDLVEEIEELKKIYNLTSYQVATLQLAALFEVNECSYDQLKREFCKK